jgi:endoglucanase
MDTLRRRRDTDHVSLLFTRAEEVGFIGAIAACQARSIPARARLICLETSRSFPESPLGAGPIVRVGDRTSVFDPSLTNAISALMAEYQRSRPDFIWQRRLMPGGTCEATAFGAFGHLATCLCLPLGNYHNMMDIDGVSVGAPAVVGPEFISVSDFHGLVEMLIVCATRLDAQKQPNLRTRMEALMQSHGHVLG